ncbi:hypothetical protein VTO42DRAFT_6406 [Malbranchea cinnamomea]
MAETASEVTSPIQDLPRSKEVSEPPEKQSEENTEDEEKGKGQADSPKGAHESTEGQANEQEKEEDDEGEEGQTSAPPLPDEEAPPLPHEPIPGQEDDGWEAIWDESSQAYYFYNRFTGVSQWENPRVPDYQPNQNGNTGDQPRSRVAGGYDPAIHGDYDPNAWYAQSQGEDTATLNASIDPNYIHTATGTFNRFTGKWQPAWRGPEYFSSENRARRQLNAYFDVDAAANSHDGRSLKAERSGKKLTKKELKAFKEKRREKKEEKRRAWLRD